MKIAREQASNFYETVTSTSVNASSTHVSQRQGNIISLQKMFFFSRAETTR